jgi:hypothetical protein
VHAPVAPLRQNLHPIDLDEVVIFGLIPIDGDARAAFVGFDARQGERRCTGEFLEREQRAAEESRVAAP